MQTATSLADYATAGVAILSLVISIVVLLRDRRSRRVDLLYRCYERVMDHWARRVSFTLDQVNIPEEEADEALKTQRKRAEDVRFDIERELNTTCYLLMKHQFSKRMFWDLFGDWLKGRYIMMNLPTDLPYSWQYTKKAVRYYQRRGQLDTKIVNHSGETADDTPTSSNKESGGDRPGGVGKRNTK